MNLSLLISSFLLLSFEIVFVQAKTIGGFGATARSHANAEAALAQIVDDEGLYDDTDAEPTHMGLMNPVSMERSCSPSYIHPNGWQTYGRDGTIPEGKRSSYSTYEMCAWACWNDDLCKYVEYNNYNWACNAFTGGCEGEEMRHLRQGAVAHQSGFAIMKKCTGDCEYIGVSRTILTEPASQNEVALAQSLDEDYTDDSEPLSVSMVMMMDPAMHKACQPSQVIAWQTYGGWRQNQTPDQGKYSVFDTYEKCAQACFDDYQCMYVEYNNVNWACNGFKGGCEGDDMRNLKQGIPKHEKGFALMKKCVSTVSDDNCEFIGVADQIELVDPTALEAMTFNVLGTSMDIAKYTLATIGLFGVLFFATTQLSKIRSQYITVEYPAEV